MFGEQLASLCTVLSEPSMALVRLQASEGAELSFGAVEPGIEYHPGSSLGSRSPISADLTHSLFCCVVPQLTF